VVRINGDLNVTGAKAAVVHFPDGTARRLSAVESPERWLEDFGEGREVGGRPEVTLDPDVAAVIGDAGNHVFLAEYDDHNALDVTGGTGRGFAAVAKGEPAASGAFSCRVVAKRKELAGRRLDPVTRGGGRADVAPGTPLARRGGTQTSWARPAP
jgi:hypothetical protein